MKYISVCSGIEATTVAWESIAAEPVFFSEIDKFPSAVLEHHYPDVPNMGDMTKFKEWPDADATILVGGTPCQSFSVAGLRKGLDDPRGNLMLTYLAIARRYRPRWLVWENVPGVLSSWSGPEPPSDLEEGQEWRSEETSDFGCLLEGLAELGYGFAYRVLDAQFFGVPQRRRRVFVVGCLGGWQRSAAVLFELHSLSWNPPPGQDEGQNVAALTANGVGTCGADDNQGQAGHLVVGPVCHNGKAAGSATLQDAEAGHLIPFRPGGHGGFVEGVGTLMRKSGGSVGLGGSETLLAVHGTQDPIVSDVAFPIGRNNGAETTLVNLTCGDRGISVDQACGNMAIAAGPGVRRLTVIECERLQGFPDNYTRIPKYSKPMGKDLEEMAAYCGFDSVEEYTSWEFAADGPRYRALGNSMAVPVMRWIGERIQKVELI